jgi:hypothetical protein
MINPDQLFKDTLHNHETPLSGNASFERVMQKRKNKRRGFFWFSLSSVLVLLLSLTAAAVLRNPVSEMEGSTSMVNDKTSGSDEPSSSANKAQTDINPIQVEASKNSANSVKTEAMQKERRNDVGVSETDKLFLNAKANTVKNKSVDLSLSGTVANSAALSNETNLSGKAIAENNGTANAANDEGYRTFFDWVKRISGCGIADEYVFQIEPTEGALLPEFVPFYPPRKARFNPIFELSVNTAGNGYKYFRESQDITVAGNHRFSQYQGIMLFDMGRGVNIGAGLGYMENVGIGKALISEWRADTNIAPVRITKAQNISYRLNKISIPLAIRYQLGFGRSLVRISATAMPGLVTLGSGTMFSRDALQSLDMLKKNAFAMDARFAAGLYYQVAPKTAISAEPMIQYQSIPGAQWKAYNRFGFGFGLGVVFRP